MDRDENLLNSITKARGFTIDTNKLQSLQDKTGATAEQIRKAMEKVGFDRDRVELYLKQYIL